MYICPTCHKEFQSQSYITKHFLDCWKDEHPYHQSKPAPRSEDIITRSVNADIADFFAALQRGGQHG